MFTLRASLFCFSFLITSCVSLDSPRDREFVIEKQWVKSTLTKTNESYRRINRSTPVIQGNIVLVGNSIDGFSAWDRASGQKLWHSNMTNGSEAGASAIKDRVFVGGSDGYVHSLNVKTGQSLWTASVKSEVLARPTLDAETGSLYVMTAANTLYALDATNGKILWLYSRQDIAPLSIRGGSQPAVKNGFVYAGFGDGYLVALKSSNGQPAWEVQLNKNKRFKDVDTTPLIHDDKIYIAGFDDRLFCISLDKGEILWRKDVGGYADLTIEGERLFYPTSTGTLYALNKETGQELWGVKLKEGVATSAIPFKGLVVVGESTGDLHFVDQSRGQVIASFEPGRGVFSAPAVDEKTNEIFFISNESHLYSLKAYWKNKHAFSWLSEKDNKVEIYP